MRKSLYITIVVFIGILWCAILPAQTAVQPEVHARLADSKVAAGGTTEYVLTIEWHNPRVNLSITPPHFDLHFLTVENIATETSFAEKKQGTVKRKVYTYTLRADGPGVEQTGPLFLSYHVVGDTEEHRIGLSPITITVVEKHLIPPMKGIVWYALVGIVLVAVLIAVLYGFFVMYRKDRARSISIEEAMLVELRDLHETLEAGEYNTVMVELDRIVRRYLHEKYGFTLINDIPLEELQREKAFVSLAERDIRLLWIVFHRAHTIKYAHIVCERHDVYPVYQDVMALVERLGGK